MSSIFAAEGGYQDFVLKGGEWTVLYLSAAAAIIALLVGVYLARSVMAEDAGTEKMQEIAKAIQVGASAYLQRQFKTIADHPRPAGRDRVPHIGCGRQTRRH